MSYEAIVARIHVKPHPNADRLLLGNVRGFQVVVGADTVDGELGIFFPTDGQLSEAYCEKNDLIGYTDPITHERKGGYFGKNRRVRSQRFRGEKSDGYFAPISSVAFTGVNTSTLCEGFTFSGLNGVDICNKYYTPATIKAMKGSTPKTRRENKCFPKHVDTVQYKYVGELPKNSILYFTEKLHGTSGRFGYIQDVIGTRKTWVDRLLRRPGKEVIGWTYLNGTRNVVMGETHNGYYGNEQFRTNATDPIKGRLHKGEVLYFELVGYTTTGQPIMGEVDTDILKDKAVQKRYGKKMVYKYGCGEMECKLYIYRITHVNEDGVQYDLPWPEVKQRCFELDLEHVPEIHEPMIYGNAEDEKDFLDHEVEELMEGPSTLDDSHIREGVVIRVESGDGADFIKSKSFTFGVLEGYIKDKDDYVDAEEIA